MWLPPAAPAALVLFFHGGFWQAQYDRKHTATLAAALAKAGFAACTPEFRRIGQAAGGWPGTFDDVALAVDNLPTVIAETTARPVPSAVVLSGHSAGGHLAMWSAARHRLPPSSPWHRPTPVGTGVVALAPVSDLAACHALALENRVTDRLLGGAPDEYPDRYALTDPASLLPLGQPLRILHGGHDDRVPQQMSRDYTTRALAAGDSVTLDDLPTCGHFELIDPLSVAWPAVLSAFQSITSPG